MKSQRGLQVPASDSTGALLNVLSKSVLNIFTENLEQYTRMADILVVAVGKPNLITADMVKEGVVVIDVGINRIPDASKKRGYALVGDADFEAIEPKA